MAPQGVPPLAHDDRTAVGDGRASTDRLPGHRLLLRTEDGEGRAEESRRGRSGAAADLRETGSAAEGARASRGRSGRCCLRQRVGGDDVQGKALAARHYLLFVFGSGTRASRPDPALPGLGRALHRQLLRDAQLGGFQRWIVLLRAPGGALPSRAVHLFPHQRPGYGPVRAHADHRGQGFVRELSRGLYRADARRESASCRGSGTGCAGGRADPLRNGAELVSGR